MLYHTLFFYILGLNYADDNDLERPLYLLNPIKTFRRIRV